MIRPTLTADGTAVRLPLDRITGPLLDALAVAYIDDADVLGQLLTAHGLAVLALEHAKASADSTEYGRAMAAAEADSTREALLGELPAEQQLDPQYGPDDAIALATRITHLAAHIRMRSTRP